MSEGVKETLCTHCTHREVCAYKRDYLDILKAVEDAEVVRATPDGKTASKKVNCYDFINRISVSCKYYQNRTEAYYRSREEDEVTACDDLLCLQMKNSIK